MTRQAPLPGLSATLDHIGLNSPAPKRLAAFYERLLRLSVTKAQGGFWGEARERRIHFLKGPAKTLAYAAYRVSDRSQLQHLRSRLAAADWPIESSPSPRFVDAVSLRDPDGNCFVFGLPESDEAESAHDAGVARLQHVVTASRNPARIASFFADVLGFTPSDNVLDEEAGIRTSFLRCSNEHHNFAVFQAPEDRLDHHCYEVEDWNAIRDWADYFAKERIPLVWGPGRHGPGNNLFLFVHDLDGNWIELSAELELVEPDRPLGLWKHEERTVNSWGRGLLRS